MNDTEALALRTYLAQAMGWTNIRVNKAASELIGDTPDELGVYQFLPDPLTSAQDCEQLIGFMRTQGYSLDMEWPAELRCYVIFKRVGSRIIVFMDGADWKEAICLAAQQALQAKGE